MKIRKIFAFKGWQWLLFSLAFLLILLAMFHLNRLTHNVKEEEKTRVAIWAEAISRTAEMVEYTDLFWGQVKQEERKRMRTFVEAHKRVMSQPLDVDLEQDFSFISENKTLPVIITDENNKILLFQNVDIEPSVKYLKGDLMKRFAVNNPFVYETYGMVFKLYYTESEFYTKFRRFLEDLTNSFLKEINDNSIVVPVLVMDTSRTKILARGNIHQDEVSDATRLAKKLRQMEESNRPISIVLPGNRHAFIFYEKSQVVKALQYYPLLYITVVIIFIIIAYLLLSTSRTAEQNLVWVGMSKETAHQLGTPISSLMAWVEYLKLKDVDALLTEGIEEDIKRLEIIAKRFSKIGSVPEFKSSDVVTVITRTIEYLKTRTSKHVKYVINIPEGRSIWLPLNPDLMEWVLENVCKNAIDAMEGKGTFTIDLHEDKKNVYIDFSDTGKGMSKIVSDKIFTPGFTTKSRGWGLGLSLSRRIIRDYHRGTIFVKKSEVGIGTTLRIILRK